MLFIERNQNGTIVAIHNDNPQGIFEQASLKEPDVLPRQKSVTARPCAATLPKQTLWLTISSSPNSCLEAKLLIRKLVCKQVIIPRSSNFYCLLWLRLPSPAMLVYTIIYPKIGL